MFFLKTEYNGEIIHSKYELSTSPIGLISIYIIEFQVIINIETSHLRLLTPDCCNLLVEDESLVI